MSVFVEDLRTLRRGVYAVIGGLRRRVRSSVISLRLVTHQLLAATVVTAIDVTFNFVNEVIESFFTLVESLVALVIGKDATEEKKAVEPEDEVQTDA
jgi:hypothetical protein